MKIEAKTRLVATGFYPEMEETHDDSKLFYGYYVHSCYAIVWRSKDDAEARAKLKGLRIRVIGGEGVKHRPNDGQSKIAKLLNSDIYTCYISNDSYNKLRQAKLTTTELRLD